MKSPLPPAPAAFLPPISCLQDDDRPWLPMDASLPGLAIKYLHINVADDEMTVLLKMPVGLALPRHRHDGAVFVYTLQGEWRYREYDWIARPGSAVLEPAGSHHTPEAIASETGAVVTFNVMRGDLVLLDEAGRETARENCRVALLRERRFARGAPDAAAPFVTR
ncbi:2,4'-dihydroxyacetophenone dioxygenase family protein [Burkholderia pseudomallei]|uniref:2,4'-dihydroxyacetophenone dioxygenase family protein n=1 Tax=Burkholderia pseudomallei TaxID=28450 RepID=UPI001AAE509E|nr:2,4'-dihydroxyacetophenone dioxygenase family protein [Burkholderia pseudomallei]MBO2951628.1 2,4'-dihydroxyacetophenone dioxygenase family protein [Burkholderia pseudomallei]MBO7785040.1 2,4'-dihydroxyacetophenone dioxygenase family protein [Burkholderia pseudomallei]MBO7798122.1 2,4'-dihydroxyacetophenone dioxygenase family protein [Burkholderia pseudomallei]MBO7816077.1 2,4'-dihydroxyacetophenone dioxygenase family protein [Burkholderia pseudomallei]